VGREPSSLPECKTSALNLPVVSFIAARNRRLRAESTIEERDGMGDMHFCRCGIPIPRATGRFHKLRRHY
jgi:hypothetical protein